MPQAGLGRDGQWRQHQARGAAAGGQNEPLPRRGRSVLWRRQLHGHPVGDADAAIDARVVHVLQRPGQRAAGGDGARVLHVCVRRVHLLRVRLPAGVPARGGAGRGEATVLRARRVRLRPGCVATLLRKMLCVALITCVCER